jgi:hypothetical protein
MDNDMLKACWATSWRAKRLLAGGCTAGRSPLTWIDKTTEHPFVLALLDSLREQYGEDLEAMLAAVHA